MSLSLRSTICLLVAAAQLIAADPVTTIPPFAELPACAVSCGPLYDVNGGCVPNPGANNVATADASVYEACFCSNPLVAPLSTAITGVCDNVCPDQNDLSSVANWFRGLCSVQTNGGTNGGAVTATTTTTGSNSGSNSGSNNNNNGGGGDWLSTHWQWVIMLVVLVVAIAGIWIGACIWRRRWLRKKDRHATTVQRQSGSAANPSWGPTDVPQNSAGSMRGSMRNSRGPGSFMPGAATSPNASPYEEKPNRGSGLKKWMVSERT